jgi:hypothetical protein
MKFQILIATISQRREMLDQLLSLLEPQIAALGLRKFEQVDVMISANDSGAEIGVHRERMRQKAEGDYIAFIDDDDLVAPDYVSTILPLLDGIDQIGFNLKYFSGHNEMQPVYHSLAHGNWTNPINGRIGVEGAFCRDISHLNPMRRELAMQVPIEGGIGEDCRWAAAMRGKVKTEHYIDRVMYYYLWRPGKQDAKDALDPWRLEMIERLKPNAS